MPISIWNGLKEEGKGQGKGKREVDKEGGNFNYIDNRQMGRKEGCEVKLCLNSVVV